MFDFSFLTAPASLSFGESNLELILSGWKASVLAFLAAMALALLLGIPVGVFRTVPRPGLLRRAAGCFVELFRNVPMLVQLFLWFFVLPELLPRSAGNWLKRDLPDPEFWTLAAALGFFMSARVAEIVRAGLQSLPRGQREASLAIGFREVHVYVLILLPQVLRIVFPPLTTEFANCFKATAIGLTIGYIELTQRTREISEQTFRTFEIFLVATLVYMLSIFTITMLLQAAERALRLPGLAPRTAGH